MLVKKCVCLAVLMLCGLVPATNRSIAGACDSGWEMVMDKNGIKADASQYANSGIFELRAVMVVDARAEVVAETLRDTPATPEWLPDCDLSYVLNMKDRSNFTSYISIDLPWPVKDRDLVMKTNTTYAFEHARAVTDFFDTTDPSAPPKKSHIRTKCGQQVKTNL